MKLIVGLGNPGAEYARQRHNVGFMALERIREENGLPAWKKRFQGVTADGEIGGARVLLLKPSTYMNESGRAVGEAARFLKIDVGDIIVIHDELDLMPGKLKVKTGGGNAGHNGLRSISASLGNEYVRVRIGIGHPGHKDLVHSWVLHDFAKSDRLWLDPMLEAIAATAGRLAAGDLERFQTDVARRLNSGGAGEPAPRSRPTGEPAEAAAKPAKPPRHPAGEGFQKRQTALAENLRRWIAGKNKTE